MIPKFTYMEYEDDGGEIIGDIMFPTESKARLLNVLKRGANTLSPPDLEIIKLIGEMEK